MTKIRLSLVVCLGVFLGGLGGLDSATLSPKERLNRVEKELAAAQANLEKYEEEQGEVDQQISALEQKISDLVADEHTHHEQIMDLQNSIQCLKDQQTQSLASLDKQHQNLSKVLGALRHLSSHSALITLAATKSKNDMVHTGILLRQLIPYLKNVSCELRQELSDLATLRERINETESSLSQTQQKVEQERENLTHLLKDKKSLQKTTQEKQDQLKRDWHRLKGEAGVLRSMGGLAPGADPYPRAFSREKRAPPEKITKEKAFEKKEGTQKEEKRGTLPLHLPVTGKIRLGYGAHRSFSPRGQGVVFAAAPGELVRAPLSGRISFVKETEDHGILMIIEGEEDYQVACGGLESLFFPSQTHVKAGQIIGRVAEEEPVGVYLDLRRVGHSVNPLSFLPSGKRSSSSVPPSKQKAGASSSRGDYE